MSATKIAAKHSPFKAASPIGLPSIVVGAEAGNVINVAITVKDHNARQAAERVAFRAYLSEHATGQSLVGTAPTSVAVGTNGLAIPLVAGKAWELVTNASGLIDLNITLSSGAATYYLILVLPDGTLYASAAITFAA